MSISVFLSSKISNSKSSASDIYWRGRPWKAHAIRTLVHLSRYSITNIVINLLLAARRLYLRRIRRRQQPRETSPLLQQQQQKMETSDHLNDYEMLRQARIKENQEKLRALGIKELSARLACSQPAHPSPATGKQKEKISTNVDRMPTRRSSRLQNIKPDIFSEALIKKNMKEELYTDEHVKLLGTCQMGWDMAVGSYGKSGGARIYHPTKGKLCHQCRQKTVGDRTCCSKCKSSRGQLCGNCLYTRYGENILEANQNPNWICPACRDICNCSACRIKKGWAPTGSIYHQAKEFGYESVAHYLIHTRHIKTNAPSLIPLKSTTSEQLVS